MKRLRLILLVVATVSGSACEGAITSFTVSPAVMTITSTGPASTPSGTATAVFVNGLAVGANSWTLVLSASSSTLTNCGQVPLSAIQVTCSSVSVTGIGGATSSCSPSFTLSTSPQTVATGADGSIVSLLVTHTIVINVTFTDSWKYPATGVSLCTLPTSYLVTRN